MEAIINYAIGILGLIGTIFGLILAIRSIRKKEPIYVIKSNNVISDFSSKYQDLTVSYKKKKVKNLTVSKVLFFNKGTEVINREDIVNIEPLRIVPKEKVEILDAKILQANKDANQFSISFDKQKNQVFIDFEYLYKNQGVVIQVIHTGLSSEDLEIKGEIKDIQNIRRLRFSKEDESNLKASRIRQVMLILAVIVLTILGTWLVGISLWGIFSLETANKFLKFIGQETMSFRDSIVGIVGGILTIYAVIRSDLWGMASLLPQGLEKFEE
jgi:hypothetical protein